MTKALPKGPVSHQLDRLEDIFGPEHFETGKILLTVARDLPGVMKVAHKLQTKIIDQVGAVVEVVMEHVKHEWWLRLHETANTMAVHKGDEVMERQVLHVPDGIREHPYRREHLPTLEALMLWEDTSGVSRGHCLFSVVHPETPTIDQVEDIFERSIAPWFAKRWLCVDLVLKPRVRGEFEDVDEGELYDPHVGEGVVVTVLACHPYGFARGEVAKEEGVAHITDCAPMSFKGISDDAGRAKLCFLPAEINKIQVSETERFHGKEVQLDKSGMTGINEGPTVVKVELTPKAVASVIVHVFVMPSKLPPAEDTDGIIDWEPEEREGIPTAQVEACPLKDRDPSVMLKHSGGDSFVVPGGGLPEGCVTFHVKCRGFEEEERTVMLLVGSNNFFIPLRKL